MQSQTQTRKRPAPGTSPQQQPQQQPPPQQPQPNPYPAFPGIADASQLSDDQFIGWARGDAQYLAPDMSGNPAFNFSPQQTNQPSNQLVRRNLNTQLTNRARSGSPAGQELWDFNNGAPNWDEDEDDESLEQRAAAAKREAQSKRPPKQIPPFIQKLSSFLDNNSNNDLIRWADDGNSFVVLDEDGFAKTLIPELFKHDKYTSFVRQLNMYGFHKRVGLSDNSMRASEKKTRSPSEYYHPYFKRGRPELLWLIQKPKNENVSSKKKKGAKKGEQEGESGDEEQKTDAKHGDSEAQQSASQNLAELPKSRLAALEQEVRQLQKSQSQITAMLQRLRDENNQYIRQASTMVAQHERHENSINAILTFLASIYNSTLQGQDSFSTMFQNAISNSQQSGNVMDMDEYEDSNFARNPTRQRRPLALLPPPTSEGQTQTSTTAQTSPRPSSAQQTRFRPPFSPAQQSRLRSATPSDKSSARPSPGEDAGGNDMMSVINNVNASAPKSSNDPRADLNSALQSFQNASGRGPLTPEQRDTMLTLMANHSGANTPVGSSSAVDQSSNPIAFLDHFQANREQLDMLQRLQQEQDSRMQDLADRLQPLSPNGYIPGLALQGGNSNDLSQFNPGDFDLDSFINDDYFPPSAAYDAPGGSSGGADFATGDINFDDFAAPGANPFAADSGAAGAPDAPAALDAADEAALFGDAGAADKDDADADGGTEGDGDGEGEGDGDGDGGAGGAEGKVLGSVGGSSSGRSPAPKVEEPDDADVAVQSPPKKRRTRRG